MCVCWLWIKSSLHWNPILALLLALCCLVFCQLLGEMCVNHQQLVANFVSLLLGAWTSCELWIYLSFPSPKTVASLKKSWREREMWCNWDCTLIALQSTTVISKVSCNILKWVHCHLLEVLLGGWQGKLLQCIYLFQFIYRYKRLDIKLCQIAKLHIYLRANHSCWRLFIACVNSF